MVKLQLTDEEKIARAKDNGIIQPTVVMGASRQTEIPFYIACAYLMQESGGGLNVFGSDRTWMRGVDLREAGLGPGVTEERYLIYKLYRSRFGNQGVGPMQLTAASLQDEADAEGGCWNTDINILVGLRFIKRLKTSDGGLDWYETSRRYNAGPNSSPPDGVKYADHNQELRQFFRDLFND